MDVVRRCLAMLDADGRSQFRWLVAGILVNGILELASVGMILPFIAVLTDPNLVVTQPTVRAVYGFSGLGSPRSFLIFLGCTLLALILFKNVYFFFVARAQARFCHFQAARSAEQLLAGYLYAPYEVHLGRNSASFINTVDHAVDQSFSQVMLSFLVLTTEIMASLCILVLLLFAEPLLTLVLVAVVGFSALAVVVYLRHVLVRLGLEATRFRLGRLQNLQQALGSAKEIKVLGREPFFVGEFRKQRQGHAAVQSQAETLSQMPRQVLEAVVAGGLVLCIVIVLLQGRVSGELVSVLALFAMAAFRIMPGINRVVSSYNTMRHASAYVTEAFRDMSDPRFRIPVAGEPGVQLGFRTDIELKNISFRYADADDPVLRNVSFKIMRGESVGIVGVSGAGKSTLIDVILGLLAPQQGQVLIDGHDIASNPVPWRRLIGYVPQMIALVDDTLRRNIAFGIDEQRIDDRMVWQALKLARLEGFAHSLPRGLETTLGERGVRISGGQRQRVGIARALYGEPEVLVFDEATSSLDNESEHEITNAIDALQGSKTLLIIAHRLSTVKRCNRLLLMNQGRIADSGSFADLLSRNEEFRNMVRLTELRSVTPLPTSAL